MSWSSVQTWSHGSIIRKLMIDDFCPSEKSAALPLSPSISLSIALHLSLSHPPSLTLHLWISISKVLSTIAFLADPFCTLVMIHFIQFIICSSSFRKHTCLTNIVSDCRNGTWTGALETLATHSLVPQWEPDYLDYWQNPLSINIIMCQKQKFDDQNLCTRSSNVCISTPFLLQNVNRMENILLLDSHRSLRNWIWLSSAGLCSINSTAFVILSTRLTSQDDAAATINHVLNGVSMVMGDVPLNASLTPTM